MGDASDLWRLAILLIVFLSLASSEKFIPIRPKVIPVTRRWLDNLALGATAFVLLSVLKPLAAAGAALFAEHQQIGLFNWLSVPPLIAIVLSLVALDFAIYWQHVAFHRIRWLWPYHRVHHTDPELDVTSAVRFHPVEILISAALKVVCVVILGAPLIAVFMFELILTGFAMFNHSNLDLGRNVDNIIRKLIVTPRMHWVHHSNDRNEQNKNFGFCLSLWDRLFKSHQQSPARGVRAIEMGVDGFDVKDSTNYFRLIKQPMVRR